MLYRRELPAMVMMDSISRMVPGVLSNQGLARPGRAARETFWRYHGDHRRKVKSISKGSGSYVRSSCKYREVAQRAVYHSYSQKAPGSAEKGRSHQQRMEFCAAAEKAVERGGIQR